MFPNAIAPCSLTIRLMAFVSQTNETKVRIRRVRERPLEGSRRASGRPGTPGLRSSGLSGVGMARKDRHTFLHGWWGGWLEVRIALAGDPEDESSV